MPGSAASDELVPSTIRISSRMYFRYAHRLKLYHRRIRFSTTKMNRNIVRETSSISRPSGSSVCSPNVPTVNAIAPNAPNGATFMMSATIRKKTSREVSSTFVSGAAPLPSVTTANPNSTAKNTICRMSPCAKASTGLEGTICIRKSANFIPCPCAAYADTSPFGIALTSSPAPGFVMFTIVSPIASANVVTISKYSSAFPPTRPIFFPWACGVMPSTIVRKMIGPITILTSFTKVSPSGRICFASVGSSTPSATPQATANSTWAVRLRESRLTTKEERRGSGQAQCRRAARLPHAIYRGHRDQVGTGRRIVPRGNAELPHRAIDHLRLPCAGRAVLDHPPPRDRSGAGRDDQRVALRAPLQRSRRIRGRSVHHPGRLRHERQPRIDRSPEHGPYAVAVGEERFHREVHLAVRRGLVAGGEYLPDDLVVPPLVAGARSHSRGIQARPQVPLARVLCGPPPQEQVVAALLIHAPVELRREIVHPSVREPLSRIRVQRGVRIEPRRDRFRVSRAPELERRDPELHPRLQLRDLPVQRLNELIDVAPSPVVARELATAFPVCLPAPIVGKIRGSVRAAFRIRIEVVVEMNAIDIVALHHVEHHAQRLRAHRRLAGIHPELRAVLLYEFRVPAREVRRRKRTLRRRLLRAERIEPRVEFQSAGVRLRHRELERIPERHRRHPLPAGEVLRPWFDLRRVQCVAGRPHLQEHRVESESRRSIQQRDELGFREGGRQPRPGRPVEIAHARDPDSSKFPRGARRNAGRIGLWTG